MENISAAADAIVDGWRKTHPWPGVPYPLGSFYMNGGTNFAIYSDTADGVDLCLFHPENPTKEVIRFSMIEQTDHVWHIFIPNVQPGTFYGYRTYGKYEPENGHVFNPNKVLIDPYAKAVEGNIKWDPSMYGYEVDKNHDQPHLHMDKRKNDAFINKSVVIDESYEWGDDQHPNTPIHKSLIYELHVKGFSALNQRIPPQLRGTYAGLAHPASIEYLLDLGVTAVELMPVHQFIQDHRLTDLGLRNYWGYNTLTFFAPHNEYAYNKTKGAQVREFKDMVKTLHKAGLEVILDVVYNHTAEGNHLGPTLNFKGADNSSYYRLEQNNKLYFTDYTGTGNTLNMVEPFVLKMVMDSLRYWVLEMKVDGFRFDLASALARGLFEVGKLSTFLDTIHQDPVISQVKLIAEPWDVGPGGYQVGNFPIMWAEWNGKYRDGVRSFWKGDEAKIPELAYRLTGSSDLYQHNGRSPTASINFVTSHDGFTLRDLVTYNDKYNLSNGEGNRDGDNHNESWNSGVEGPTDAPNINALRAKQQRNFLATLLLSQGVPMLSMGDEYGRTQLGNNNAYCQDNPISYFDWDWSEEQSELHLFVRDLIKLRADNPVLRRRRFFTGRPIKGENISDIIWLTAEGKEMTDDEWNNGSSRSLGMLLNGAAMDEYDEHGLRIRDDIFLLIVNSYWEEVNYRLPGEVQATDWSVVVDTTDGTVEGGTLYPAQTVLPIEGRSLIMLVREPHDKNEKRRKHWKLHLNA